MLQYFSADWIFPVSSPPIKNGVIAVNEGGIIAEIFSAEQAKTIKAEVKKYRGAIVPGFINTHCHIELSAMRGIVPKHTGLVKFVETVITKRGQSTEEIDSAMLAADAAMWQNGIVAVGDISNNLGSKKIKLQSNIHYHTFIETLGFNPAKAEEILENAIALRDEFLPLKSSIVPHAPYSVSAKLIGLLNDYASINNDFLSIHNQESQAENLFFEKREGDFLPFFNFLGIDVSHFQASGKSSLKTWLSAFETQKTLLVHNTFSSKADVEFAKQHNPNLYWCLCPQANLYIENTLPDVQMLIDEEVKITLGTDSLASNDQLNILAEMQILQKQKNIPFENLLSWATKNGAGFLNLDAQFGSLEKGKRPGLNLIQLSNDFEILSNKVEKLL
ncbi:cytosine/adenosine deaminase-related metal-dependent hydrolase [Pedobacter sp. UYP30]|uniref:amidohydrolase family protein n=1 Tax=Pedobacter sp. UYP30 TaxID=1756400 RepID=UPI003394EA99